MFEKLRLFGRAGDVLWGYRPAIELTSWEIVQNPKKQWILTGTPKRIDAFGAKQPGLLFTAPRPETRDGFWSFGVERMIEVGPRRIVAQLGPPER